MPQTNPYMPDYNPYLGLDENQGAPKDNPYMQVTPQGDPAVMKNILDIKKSLSQPTGLVESEPDKTAAPTPQVNPYMQAEEPKAVEELQQAPEPTYLDTLKENLKKVTGEDQPGGGLITNLYQAAKEVGPYLAKEYIKKPVMNIVDTAGKTAAVAAFPFAEILDSLPGLDTNKAKDYIVNQVNEFEKNQELDKADPSMSLAGHVFRSVEELVPLIFGMGPAVAVPALVAEATTETGLGLAEQGVKPSTAGAIGAVSGLASYGMMHIPLQSESLLAQLAKGATAFPAIGMGTKAAEKGILTATGDTEQAKDINVFDKKDIANDIAMGLIFGAMSGDPKDTASYNRAQAYDNLRKNLSTFIYGRRVSPDVTMDKATNIAEAIIDGKLKDAGIEKPTKQDFNELQKSLKKVVKTAPPVEERKQLQKPTEEAPETPPTGGAPAGEQPADPMANAVKDAYNQGKLSISHLKEMRNLPDITPGIKSVVDDIITKHEATITPVDLFEPEKPQEQLGLKTEEVTKDAETQGIKGQVPTGEKGQLGITAPEGQYVEGRPQQVLPEGAREGETKTTAIKGDIQNDQKDKQRLQGGIGEGQKSLQAQPIQGPGGEATGTGGILQKQKEVTPSGEKQLKPAEPNAIASKLGVRYDGVQGDIGPQWTDLQTGSTFYTKTLDENEVSQKVSAMREKFKAAEVPETPEPTTKATPEVKVKEPWEMTQDEYASDYAKRVTKDLKPGHHIEDVAYINAQGIHHGSVQQALSEGKLSVEDYNKLHAKDYGPIEKFAPDLAEKVKPAKPPKTLKEIQKARSKKIADAPTIREWFKLTGGVNPHDRSWKGELDRLRWTYDSKGKKRLAKGLGYGFWNNKARGLDERVTDAIEHGWLPPGSTDEDLYNAIAQNLDKKWSEVDNIDNLIDAENKRLEEIERSLLDEGYTREQIERAEGEQDEINQRSLEEGYLTPEELNEVFRPVEKPAEVKPEAKEPPKGQAELFEKPEEKFELKPTEPVSDEEKIAWERSQGKIGRGEKTTIRPVIPTETIPAGTGGKQETLFGPKETKKGETGELFGKKEVKTEIVPFSKDLDIRNVESLSRGTGARYLEVIKGEGDEYVAKQWRRKPIESGILIDFEPKATGNFEDRIHDLAEAAPEMSKKELAKLSDDFDTMLEDHTKQGMQIEKICEEMGGTFTIL